MPSHSVSFAFKPSPLCVTIQPLVHIREGTRNCPVHGNFPRHQAHNRGWTQISWMWQSSRDCSLHCSIFTPYWWFVPIRKYVSNSYTFMNMDQCGSFVLSVTSVKYLSLRRWHTIPSDVGFLESQKKKRKKRKEKHIMSRHQRDDANVVKGLSFVSLVNLLSGVGKMRILTFGSVDSKLSIAHYFSHSFSSIFGSCGWKTQ